MSNSNILRIKIKVKSLNDGEWAVTYRAPNHLDWQPPPRTMIKTMVKDDRLGRHLFPRPTQEEVTEWFKDCEPHCKLCKLCSGPDKDLANTYRRIVNRSPLAAQKDVSTFGSYLFESLIGPQTWESHIIPLAQEKEAHILELALAWDSTENELHRLNWEMMFSPKEKRFLAAKRPDLPQEIAITRIVSDTEHKPRDVSVIPRFLFVIGTTLTDKRVRPGAEYLGLLRQIDRSGRAIQSRVLRKTKPQELTDAMSEFAPHVVHFICHGEFDDRGNAKLELQLDDEDKDGDKMRDSDALFTFLSAGEKMPSIVVLSACNTGQAGDAENEEMTTEATVMAGAHQTAPLAAKLVQSGVPVVIGMAGRVADSACRYFTRRFGEAIAGGVPLVTATAEGRRAAFAYNQAEKTVDWAFPAVFLSESVEADFTPIPMEAQENLPPVEEWVSQYNKKRGREPAFYGRHKFFDAYYDLFKKDEPSVIAAYVVPINARNISEEDSDRGFGKTRLLKELTVQAVRDGHIPIVVSSDRGEWEPPKTIDALLSELTKALNRARRVYGVDKQDWQVLQLRNIMRGEEADLHDDVEEVYEEEDYHVKARVIRVALEKDVSLLIAKAHAIENNKFLLDSKGRAILYLDEVHKYHHADFLDEWFTGDVLKYGLGRGNDNILPVVMTLSRKGAPNTVLKATQEDGESLYWLRAVQLRAFPPADDIDMLAVDKVLLNPWENTVSPDISDKPFTVNWDVDKKNWIAMRSYYEKMFNGLPVHLGSGDFYTWTELAFNFDFLLKADDETQLKTYMDEDD